MPGTLYNGDDTAVTGWGGSAVNCPARGSVAQGAATDAQAITGVDAGAKRAILDASVSNAGKAAIASVLLDELVSSVDLSTPAKRKAARLKSGLQELEDILAQIAPDTAI